MRTDLILIFFIILAKRKTRRQRIFIAYVDLISLNRILKIVLRILFELFHRAFKIPSTVN